MNVLIVEIGSYASKLGFAGEDEPRFLIPTVVGLRKSSLKLKMVESILKEFSIDVSKDLYFGNDAIDRSLGLDLKHPVSGPILKHPEFVEKFLEHALQLLNIRRQFHGYAILLYPIMVSEDFLTALMDYFYRELKVLGVCLVSQPYASLLSNDQQTTGLIVEVGHKQTQILPVLKGHSLPGITGSIGGADITNHLKQLIGSTLKSLDEPIAGVSPSLIITDIKYKLCELNPFPRDKNEHFSFQEETRSKKKEYILPDNSLVHLDIDRFLAPEVLFQASLAGKEDSLPDLIVRSIEQTESSLTNYFYQNIFLSGGSADFKNIEKRLEAELSLIVPSSKKVRVRKLNTPSFLNSWRGASKLGIVDNFSSIILKATDYLASPRIEMNKALYPTIEKLQIVPPPIHVFLKPIPKTYTSRIHKLIVNFVEKSPDGLLHFKELVEFFQKPEKEILKLFIHLLADGRIEGVIDEKKGVFIRKDIDRFGVPL